MKKIKANPNPKLRQVFGLELNSAYPFTDLPIYLKGMPVSSAGVARVHFSFSQESPAIFDLDEAELISHFQYDPPEANLCDKLYLLRNAAVWQFAWGADYYIKANSIECYLRDPQHLSLVEPYLMGTVLAFWLEWHGLPSLHSSAVAGADGAIAFLANSGSGKSSLAAACLRAGAALLSDDILPLESLQGNFFGRPGLPQINLWPDQAAYFIGQKGVGSEPISTTEKKKYPITAFQNGVFCDESQPLACLYIPERYEPLDGETKIEIRPVPAVEAVIELLRYSFIPAFICEEMGWQARRMDFFARLVEQVPVRRLRYPSGFEYLPAVAEAVLRDAERT